MSTPSGPDLPSHGDVLVQVVPVDQSGEIGWGGNITEQLQDRLADIRTAIAIGAKAVADSIDSLPHPEGWEVGDVSAKFGVTLTAQAGVIISQVSAAATFEVTVRFAHPQPATSHN